MSRNNIFNSSGNLLQKPEGEIMVAGEQYWQNFLVIRTSYHLFCLKNNFVTCGHLK